MTIARNIFLLLHVVGFLGILGALLSQIPKPQKRILGGVLHSALLSLISGIALVGIRTSLHASDAATWEAPDHTKVGIKFLILAVILFLGYKNYMFLCDTYIEWGSVKILFDIFSFMNRSSYSTVCVGL